MPTLSGTVKDANGNFAQRLVRAHRRDTGAFVAEALSNASTGAFSLTTADSSKHYIVVHDNDAWITYLPFNGADNSTLFYEYGGKTVTPSGNVKISTAQYKFGGASAYFDGTGDYLTIPASNDLAFGTDDFTVEAWVRPDSLGVERAIFDNRAASNDTGLYFGINASNQITAFGNGGAIVTGTTTAITAATTWAHCALVKRSGTMYLYLNGSLVGSAASAYSITCPGSMVIGRKLGSTSNDFVGYMDDMRISKGKAQYLDAFTPSTQPHMTFGTDGDQYWSNVTQSFHCEGANGSTSVTDVVTGSSLILGPGCSISTSAYAVGSSSLAIVAGAGSSVQFPSAETLTFGTNDFTLEFFINLTALSSYTIFSRSGGFSLRIDAAGGLTVWNASTSYLATSSGALSSGAFRHVAVNRIGGVMTIFVDGVPKASGTVTQNFVGSGACSVCGANAISGNIDDIRVTKGVGRYSGVFSKPTAQNPDGPSTFITTQANAVVYDLLTPI